MASRAMETGIIGFVLLAAVLWLEMVSGEALIHGLKLLAAWALASTLAVAAAGAWMALRRSRLER